MTLRILIIEDEESNMKILTLSLQLMGHQVMGAFNPELGLQLAVSEQPDLILMDLMFKGASIDGIEAIRRLKADPATRMIPVVAQTASVLDYTELNVCGAGAEGFIRKPFRRKELMMVVDQVMSQAKNVASAVVPAAIPAPDPARFSAKVTWVHGADGVT